MNDSKFKIGDVVRVKFESQGAKKGSIFRVGYIQRNYAAYPGPTHSQFSYSDTTHTVVKPGFVIPENNLELVESAHVGKILIMVDEKDPNKIIARDLLTNKTAEAKRNPKDEWDFAKGAKLALERLMEPEKPKYWTGKVVCVKNKLSSHFFTEGKVYKIVNGSLLDNDNDPNDPYLSCIENLRDLYIRASSAHEFIEYKGGAEE